MKTYKWFFLICIAVVFVACGSDSEEELVGNWVVRSEFDGGPRGYTANFVIGNKGYVCCGWNGNKARRAELYEYDPTTSQGMGSWRRLTDFPGTARSQAVGFSVAGKGYVGTGWDGDTKVMRDFYEYNPANNSWRRVATLPDGQDGARERYGAIAFSLWEGDKEYGYIGTGYTGGDEKLTLKDFWRFDPAAGDSGRWEQVQGFGGSKREGAVAFVINNKAYICTGKNSSMTVPDIWEFDPNLTNPDGFAWHKKRNMYDSNPDEDFDDDYADLMRSYAVSFVMPVGGVTRGHIAIGSGKSTVWEYDADTDLWEKRTTFVNNSTPRTRDGAVAFSFPELGRAFVGMGMSNTVPYDDMREFYPLEEDSLYDDQ